MKYLTDKDVRKAIAERFPGSNLLIESLLVEDSPFYGEPTVCKQLALTLANGNEHIQLVPVKDFPKMTANLIGMKFQADIEGLF